MSLRRKFWTAFGSTFGILFVALAGALVYLKDWFALGLTVVVSLVVAGIVFGTSKYLGSF